MDFSIRRSFKLGPLGFNLSKSGVGISAGVEGAGFGVNAKGKKYVDVGRGGIYDRQMRENSSQPEPDQAGTEGFEIGWGNVVVILAAAYILHDLRAA
jgi:hypothetical protein